MLNVKSLYIAFVVQKDPFKSKKIANVSQDGTLLAEYLLVTRTTAMLVGTPLRLSATAYSIYSQRPSILDAVPPS